MRLGLCGQQVVVRILWISVSVLNTVAMGIGFLTPLHVPEMYIIPYATADYHRC